MYLNNKQIENKNWFPGHIAKAIKNIQQDIKKVDVIIEILDARAPLSTKNNDINKYYEKKPHLLVLNKYDLSSENKNKFYKKYYEDKGYFAIFTNSKVNNINKIVNDKIHNICKDIINNKKNKGIINYQLKAMILGMPNVGKSTFINSFIKKKVAKAIDKPGVTRTNQWYKMDDIMFLDTPGITPKKFSSGNVYYNLSLLNVIENTAINITDMALNLISYLKIEYPHLLMDRYKLTENDINNTENDIMGMISKNIGALKKGSEYDYEKVSNKLIADFRTSKLGKITLYEEL